MRFLFLVAPVLAWQGGVGVRSIDPSPSEIATNQIYLGGYGALGFRGGALGYARGINDPVEARAYYVEDDFRNGMAHIVLDAIGVGNRLMDDIRNGASLVTGLSPNNVLVTATHSHCGPDLQGLWGGVTANYRRLVVERSIEAISEAFQTRQRANIYVSAVDPGATFNNNRRGWGWAINTTTVLDIRNAATDRRIGTVINFAAHPVTLGANVLDLSSDYVGYLRQYVERTFAGAPVIFVPGAIGDVSPGSSGGAGFERARLYGERIGQVAIDAMRRQQDVIRGGTLRVVRQIYSQLVTNELFMLAWFSGVLSNYYAMTVLPDDTLGVENSVMYLRIGDSIEGVTFPGESLTRHGQSVRSALRAPFHFLFGLTQNSLGYYVPTDEWMTGRNNNYEESISTTRLAGDEARDRLLALIRTGQEEEFSPNVTDETPTPRQREAMEKLKVLLRKAQSGELKVEDY
jgi:hypothetical protein